MIHLYVLPLVAFDLASGAFDAYETVKGLKTNKLVEGNGIINFISGASKTQKPATWAIIVYNVVKTGASAGLSLFASPVAIGGSIGALVASTAGHIQGGVKANYLNNGGQINAAAKYTWWQKLLGMGWF